MHAPLKKENSESSKKAEKDHLNSDLKFGSPMKKLEKLDKVSKSHHNHTLLSHHYQLNPKMLMLSRITKCTKTR